MARVTPEQYAEKQSRRLKQALPDMEAGIRAVQTAPGQLAAAKADKWAQKVMDSKAKWRTNTAAVGLEQWKQAAINKGLSRVSVGIDEAQPKVVAMASRLLPAVDAAAAAARAMPDLTLQDSIARASKFITEMAKFKK